MFGKVFGANVDWISQHSVLPEYFRQQFYDTGQLFPEFAANIGGGQNIYNFSYYGLYSPLILPSYFLPFLKMSDYMIAVSLLCLLADVLLFYKWLRQNDVSKGNTCLTSLLFLLSGLDLSFLQSDHVCQLYAVSSSRTAWRRPVFLPKKERFVYGQCFSYDHDQFLFQYRRNPRSGTLWDLPLFNGASVSRRQNATAITGLFLSKNDVPQFFTGRNQVLSADSERRADEWISPRTDGADADTGDSVTGDSDRRNGALICVFISSRLRPVARSLPSVRHRTYHTCDHGTSDRTYLPYMAGKIHPYCLYPCDLDPVLSIYIERWSLYPRKSTDPDDSASLLSDRNLSGKTKKPGDPVFSRGRSLCNNAWNRIVWTAQRK